MLTSTLLSAIFVANIFSLALSKRAFHIDKVTVNLTVVVYGGDIPPSPTRVSLPEVEIKVALYCYGSNYQHGHDSKRAHVPSANSLITYVATSPPPPYSSPPTQPFLSSKFSASPAEPSDVSASGVPTSGGVPLIATVNKWRTAYGVNTLKWNSTLEANALKTGNDDHGSIETHKLNLGSMAQVITPGQEVSVGNLHGDSPFDLSYITWLCEVPTDPELEGQCQTVADVLHIKYNDTGHNDILCSKSYTAIGCAFARNIYSTNASIYQGLWVCDLH
ncbi:MAG: hypothetical protein Q9175_001530 [Cornicularia normoerica]